MKFLLEKVCLSLFLLLVGANAYFHPVDGHNLHAREIHVPHPRLRRVYEIPSIKELYVAGVQPDNKLGEDITVPTSIPDINIETSKPTEENDQLTTTKATESASINLEETTFSTVLSFNEETTSSELPKESPLPSDDNEADVKINNKVDESNERQKRANYDNFQMLHKEKSEIKSELSKEYEASTQLPSKIEASKLDKEKDDNKDEETKENEIKKEIPEQPSQLEETSTDLEITTSSELPVTDESPITLSHVKESRRKRNAYSYFEQKESKLDVEVETPTEQEVELTNAEKDETTELKKKVSSDTQTDKEYIAPEITTIEVISTTIPSKEKPVSAEHKTEKYDTILEKKDEEKYTLSTSAAPEPEPENDVKAEPEYEKKGDKKSEKKREKRNSYYILPAKVENNKENNLELTSPSNDDSDITKSSEEKNMAVTTVSNKKLTDETESTSSNLELTSVASDETTPIVELEEEKKVDVNKPKIVKSRLRRNNYYNKITKLPNNEDKTSEKKKEKEDLSTMKPEINLDSNKLGEIATEDTVTLEQTTAVEEKTSESALELTTTSSKTDKPEVKIPIVEKPEQKN